jgi:hypothetical protein
MALRTEAGERVAGPTYKRSIDLLEADIGDELVALDAEAGICFGFNSVATSVWRSLAQPKSFDQLRNELMREYDVGEEQCSEELTALLDDMCSKSLIERSL